jgi:hypothetical protein
VEEGRGLGMKRLRHAIITCAAYLCSVLLVIEHKVKEWRYKVECGV